MDHETFDVAVIGLGPVGSALANVLGQYGLSTVVLDRETSAYHLPRACACDDEVMRIFQSMGLASPMSDVMEAGGDAHFVDAEGNRLVSWSRPQERSANGWYVNYRFYQPALEDVLRAGFARYPSVSALWACEVTDLEQDDGGVTVRYQIASEPCELRAAYVVGCDGARSFTRAAMQSPVEDLGFHEPWLIIDLKLKQPETEPDRNTYHYCTLDPSGTKVFVGSKRKRWEFRLDPDQDADAIRQPENVWRMLERWIGPEQADLERTAVYTFHSTVAEQWRWGRLFIAGDAAHQTPPFMGQGMCAGMRDAANLGWKLAWVLQRNAAESLLDTYQSERRPARQGVHRTHHTNGANDQPDGDCHRCGQCNKFRRRPAETVTAGTHPGAGDRRG